MVRRRSSHLLDGEARQLGTDGQRGKEASFVALPARRFRPRPRNQGVPWSFSRDTVRPVFIELFFDPVTAISTPPGVRMQNVKLLKLLLLSAVGCLCASACSLPAPAAGDGGSTTTVGCAFNAADAGAVDAVSTVIATGDVENVITPVACSASNAPNPAKPSAIDKYSQGYDYADPKVLAKLNPTMAGISVHDEMLQMGGMPYGSSSMKNYTNTQRSQDTANIRGFRYRDASRGVNLGEDINGTHPMNIADGQKVGYSTAFPVSMARGAAFDLDLEYAVGEAIGDEMQAVGETLLLAPCMNLLRHPYWGRAQEVYGEDPYQTGRLASAMVYGIQEHIAANAKHYMAYDVEAGRQTNVSDMDEQTLREIYGRHFRMVAQDSGVASVMASYNSVNGAKSTINKHTLTEVLRQDFGFKGFILSDWWAVPGKDNILDVSTQTNTAKNLLSAGLDVELPWLYNYGNLQSLYNTGNVQKKDLDAAASRILYEKYRFNADSLTGTVGLKQTVTHYDAAKGAITCDATHLALAKRAALESMVLLKNDGVLPISPAVKNLAVVGATLPFAVQTGSLSVNFATDVRGGDLGSSRVYPDPAKSAGPFQGFCEATGGTFVPVPKDAPPGTQPTCSGGSVNVTTATNDANGDLTAALSAANAADFVVVVAGLTPQDEGEEYTLAADRSTNCNNPNACLELDAKQTGAFAGIQDSLIAQVAASGKPMVVVLEGGSVINMPWLPQVHALVMAWYPGQRGGEALADLLWGQVGGVSYNFGGKLPITWGLEQQYGDPFDTPGGETTFDYYVGYRYFDYKQAKPVFPFGAGQSYTSFALTNLQLGCSSMAQGAVLPVVVNVKNTGTVAGDDTVMVFVSFPQTKARRATKELKGFARVSLAPGEAKQVTVQVRLSDLDYFQADSSTATTGNWYVESGPVDIMVTDGTQNPTDGTTVFLPTQTVNVTGYMVGPAQ
jgi:beta-glucosidase